MTKATRICLPFFSLRSGIRVFGLVAFLGCRCTIARGSLQQLTPVERSSRAKVHQLEAHAGVEDATALADYVNEPLSGVEGNLGYRILDIEMGIYVIDIDLSWLGPCFR